MTEFEKGYEQGYKDGMAGAALPNINDNGDKIDGYSYAYKTDSIGEPYIHIDSVRSMMKKAADVQPVKHGRWKQIGEQSAKCTACGGVLKSNGKDKTGKALIFNAVYHYCPYCGARMDGDSECQ